MCIGFIALNLACLRLGLFVAEQVVLRYEYGSETVDREHLRLIELKPALRVSNGDRLESWTFRHFLISAAVWLSSAVPTCLLISKVLPAEYRDISEWRTADAGEDPDARGVSCLVVVLIFLTLVFSCIGAMWVDALFF
jgi:hypothetical protein